MLRRRVGCNWRSYSAGAAGHPELSLHALRLDHLSGVGGCVTIRAALRLSRLIIHLALAIGVPAARRRSFRLHPAIISFAPTGVRLCNLHRSPSHYLFRGGANLRSLIRSAWAAGAVAAGTLSNLMSATIAGVFLAL
nr:hypothetical protein [Klebsiella pneumoniae]